MPSERIATETGSNQVAVFNESNFSSKLDAVLPTQESIQSLGLWIMHHKINHEIICQIWINKLSEDSLSSKKKLALFYLANEVIQNCRRKNAKIFMKTFREVLVSAIDIVSREESIVKNVERVLNVWLERKIYDKEFVNRLISQLQEKSSPLKSPEETNFRVMSRADSTEEKKPAGMSSLDSNTIDEIILKFQTKKLFESLASFQNIINEVNLEKTRLEVTRMIDLNNDNLKQHRDKSQCIKLKTELDNSCVQLEKLLTMFNSLTEKREELIKMLEKSEIFYEAQYEDAKKVNNIFRIYGGRVQLMKKKVEEHMNQKFENKFVSDMEMSDEESKEGLERNQKMNHHSHIPPLMSSRFHLDPRQKRNSFFDTNKK